MKRPLRQEQRAEDAMANWKRLCCAVDLSEPSHLAMADAAALARQLGAELTLLHVFEAPAAVTSGMLVSPPELFSTAERVAQSRVEDWRAEAEDLIGAPVQVHVAPGDPAEQIVRFAAAHHMDAVVLATRGRTGISRALLGSVAERVVRTAGCPVVVTRRPEPPERSA